MDTTNNFCWKSKAVASSNFKHQLEILQQYRLSGNAEISIEGNFDDATPQPAISTGALSHPLIEFAHSLESEPRLSHQNHLLLRSQQ